LKIVLDTNVLASGVFFSGAPNKVLKRWLDGQLQLCVSADILSEYDRILNKMASKIPGFEISGILELIRSQAHIVLDTALEEKVCSDPDDDKFIACALESQAMLVVSGDAALLKTDGYKGVQVLRPAPFLVFLDEKAPPKD